MIREENEKIIRQFLVGYNEFKNSNEYKFENGIESIIYDSLKQLEVFEFSDDRKNEAIKKVTTKHTGEKFKSVEHWKTFLKRESKIILIKDLIISSCKNNVDLESVIMNKITENF